MRISPHVTHASNNRRTSLFATRKSEFIEICIGLSSIFSIIAAAGTILSFIATYKSELIIPATTTTTTTRQGLLSIGEECQFNNQCPEQSFCDRTCQCSLHFYQNVATGNCTLRSTNAASCSSDFECNLNVGLKCSNGTCQCDIANQFWNSSYVVGAGMPNGRCQNRKVHGMPCNGSDTRFATITTSSFGAQITRCLAEFVINYNFNFVYGISPKRPGDTCLSNDECQLNVAICMDYADDGIKRCTTIPTINWYTWYNQKLVLNGSSCNLNTFACNEWRNLVCRYNSGTGTCQCFDEYYYWNSTMCVNGRRMGESCSASTQCTPTSAGMVCDFAYSGAPTRVCRCAIGTQYYDTTTRTCRPLKTYNSACRDNTECLNNNMFCGYVTGGSQLRCLCTDASYYATTACVARLAYNTTCTSTTQCMNHLNQVCTTVNRCGCVAGKYYRSSDASCQPLKYFNDSCASNTECWSKNCVSFACA